MSVKNTLIFLPEICGTVFVVLSRDGIWIWIIIKILINEEKPDYTLKCDYKIINVMKSIIRELDTLKYLTFL